jgi:methylmalonyl-CoA mutase
VPESGRAIIHARGALRSQTLLDRHVNILRGSAGAFAATVGGVDSLELPPFDAAMSETDALAQRIAINTQHLLHEESQIGQVIDPGGGAWYIEALTDALARRAWALFQEVERRGGMAGALRSGFVQERIAATATQRDQQIAARRAIVVGTNLYVNPDETLPAVPKLEPAKGGLLHPRRDAELFERLRMRAEAGERPRAFLANLGPRAQHRARADFATGFLLAGGIAVIDNGGFATPEEAGAAAVASGAPIVVICSTDATYPALVSPLITTIRAQRPDVVCLLAGYPPDQIEAHRAAGVDCFIHLRADAVATLDQILSKLGR